MLTTRQYSGFHASLSLADRDDRRREQRRSWGVFRPDWVRPEAAGGRCPAHFGLGFPAVALHGGAAGRSRRRGPVRETPVLWRATARPIVKGQSSKRFLSGDIERSMLAMRQGVCDVRRAVSWLNSRPDVDGTRLAVAGISLGGIVASVAAAVDPAIQHGAFLLAGGDLSVILWGMPEGAPFRKLWLDSGRTQARSQGLDRPVRPTDLRQTASRQARAHDCGQSR